jgi:hypothetical protein
MLMRNRLPCSEIDLVSSQPDAVAAVTTALGCCRQILGMHQLLLNALKRASSCTSGLIILRLKGLFNTANDLPAST